jgi:two-component system, response regulator RpfG
MSNWEDVPQSVLIVDDQQTSIEVLAGIVSGLPGAPRVASFQDPLEALPYAAKHQQDLVLLDHQMPSMSGISFLSALRAFSAYRTVPVVMVTILEDRDVRMAALKAGATDFLTKPIDVAECKARCANLLEWRRDSEELKRRAQLAASALDSSLRSQHGMDTTRAKEYYLWMASVVDEYCGKGAEHIIRISHYSALIAEGCGIPEADVMDVLAAAATHDIGQIAVPQHIMRKTSGNACSNEAVITEVEAILKTADQAISRQDWASANESLKKGLDTLGDRYISPTVDDDTGMNWC